MAITGAIKVDFGEVFPQGRSSCPRSSRPRTGTGRRRDNHVQQLVRDEDGNPVMVDGLEVRVWQVQVMDGDPSVPTWPRR